MKQNNINTPEKTTTAYFQTDSKVYMYVYKEYK